MADLAFVGVPSTAPGMTAVAPAEVARSFRATEVFAPEAEDFATGASAFGQAAVGIGAMVVGAAAGMHRGKGGRQARRQRATLAAMASPTQRPGYTREDIRFFLDTADEKEWDRFLSLGMFYGVTSNPAIMEKCNQPITFENIERLAKKALSYPNVQTILFQTWGDTADVMEKNGERIFKIDPGHVGVKLPLTEEGIKAAARLKAKGAIICMTACLSAKQALTANAIGADYISPYLGKMDEAGMEALDEVTRMHEALKGVPSRCRIFTASFRNVHQLMELACRGLDAFTFPPLVAEQLLACDATYEFAKKFEVNAKNMGAP